MANSQLDTVMRYLRRVVGIRENAGLTDTRLLERFVASQDQAAFEVLVWRHGPMVMGVCRRVLRHTQDAEDAFQATFLALARKAGSLQKRGSLAGWLYTVAYRIALRAKGASAKRSAHQEQGVDLYEVEATMEETDAMARRELRAVLDEELDQLPEKYRTLLVLCYLQGKSHAQAAQELGWPVGSMSRHLQRARGLLSRRLARRGVILSAGLLGTALAQETTAAMLSTASVLPAVQAAMISGVAKAVAAGKIPAKVAALAQEALKAMWVANVKIGAALVLGLALATTSLGIVAHRAFTAEQPTAEPENKPRPETGCSQLLWW